MHSARSWLPALALAAGCVLTYGARRQGATPLAGSLGTIPARLAGASGVDREIDAATRQVAGMTNYVFRVFKRDSSSAFSVYVGYYDNQTTGRTIHSPRNCLPGAGWQVVESGPSTLTLPGGERTVNRYILANGPSQALVYYWYQGRGRVAWSEYRVKWELLRDAVVRGRTEEALVRIVVPIDGSSAPHASDWQERVENAERVAREAAAELIPAVNRVLPGWNATA
jgi:EpsI family protein